MVKYKPRHLASSFTALAMGVGLLGSSGISGRALAADKTVISVAYGETYVFDTEEYHQEVVE